MTCRSRPATASSTGRWVRVRPTPRASPTSGSDDRPCPAHRDRALVSTRPASPCLTEAGPAPDIGGICPRAMRLPARPSRGDHGAMVAIAQRARRAPARDALGPWALDVVHNVDCARGLRALPDDCLDVIVTSPPYWG